MSLRLTTLAQSKSAQRYEALLAGEAIAGETYPRAAATGGGLMTSGSVYYTAMGLLAGDVVTNILTMCNVLGSGFSGVGVKVGLYSKALGLLAVSGDTSAQYAAAQAVVNPLTAPYTVPATDLYYAAIICVITPGTMPTLMRGAAALQAGTAFTGGSRAFGAQTGQTDLPATGAQSAAVGSQNNYWFGWS